MPRKMDQQIIRVDPALSLSKYRQVVQSLQAGIKDGLLGVGDRLPSINQVCRQWSLSRDTVLKAYGELQSQGLVYSTPGKGFFVASTRVDLEQNIFVLFDELNAFKEDLYASFLKHLGDRARVEIFFHHFNRKLFENLLEQYKRAYTTFVVMPAKFHDTAPLLKGLPGRVVVLDQLPDDLRGLFPAVYQNFDKDIYDALTSGAGLLGKYDHLVMVYPGGKEPEGQRRGFVRFCEERGDSYEVLSDLQGRTVRRGEAYVAIWDRDLVELVRQARRDGLHLGTDLGIISYNDTELKEVVAGGITTVSTDFKEMGRILAGLVLGQSGGQIENPSSLIKRASL